MLSPFLTSEGWVIVSEEEQDGGGDAGGTHLNDLTLLNMEKKVVMSVMSDGKDVRLYD